MGAPPPHRSPSGGITWNPQAHRDRDDRLLHHVARLFAPDAESLRCPPEQAARMLRLVTFSGSHPLISHGQPLTPEEIVELVLHGIIDTAPTGGTSC
jgi:hypothetical protein